MCLANSEKLILFRDIKEIVPEIKGIRWDIIGIKKVVNEKFESDQKEFQRTKPDTPCTTWDIRRVL